MTQPNDSAAFHEAIVFATRCHQSQLRKGSTVPYILHPLETMQILSTMDADTDLLIAGLLHDVAEDTDVTVAEIQQRFGAQVAALVGHHSEDKEKTWIVRKTTAIQEAQQASRPMQMLLLADKLSNLRSIARDHARLGDALWERFNAPKEKQAWYYNGMLSALAPLAEEASTAAAYEEAMQLYKDVFVLYKITPTYDRMYMANTFGEAFCLTKGNPQWVPVNYRFRNNDIALTRKEAESLEDKWYDLFLNAVEQDLADITIPLLAVAGQQQLFQLQDGQLRLTDGDSLYQLNADDTYELLTQLRAAYSIAPPLAQLVFQVFGNGQPGATLQQLCQELALHCMAEKG